MTIRITGDGPKITATGSGSTVLVEISTGQHDPGSFSGVHNDLTGRSTTGAHVGTAVSIDPTGFNGNLDGTIVNAQLLAAAVDDLTTGGGGGVTGDSELVATSTTLTGPPHTIAVAAAGSIDITVTLPDATAGDKGLVWFIRNLNSDSVVYVANLAEGDETITESKGLLVAGIETDTPGTYVWMKVGFVSETGTAGGGAALSDATPQALGTAAAGTGTAAARDDHVHAMPTAADVGADAAGAAQAVADSLGGAALLDVGTTTGTVAAGDDSRLSDARTPTAHKTSHATGGSDALTASDIGAATSGHDHSGVYQPVDADLTTIAGLTATTDSFIQAKSSAWAARTIAQVQTDLKVEPVRHKYIHNQYHVLVRMNQDRSDSTIYAPGANVVAAKLVEIVEPVQLSGRWFVVEASTASAVFRPGLYASSDSTGLPTGSPLLTTPAVDASSTGYKLDTFTASSTLQPGYYWEITASSHGTAGWRGGPTYSIADMGHTSGGAIANRSFTSSWSYSSGGLPDVSAFTWTASVSLHAPVIRWRTERV